MFLPEKYSTGLLLLLASNAATPVTADSNKTPGTEKESEEESIIKLDCDA